LRTLVEAIKKGYKSYILFLVQIQNTEYFKIAKDIDNEYYQNYLLAKKAGVQFLAYRCKVDPKEIKIEKKLKILDE
jgi:sugar fermentation stimulation protein A